MHKNPQLHSKKVGSDREDFELEVQPVPVRIERALKERLIDIATIAVTTVTATVLSAWLMMLIR